MTEEAIKTLVELGCTISYPAKWEREEYIGNATIRIYNGYFSKPEILVDTQKELYRSFPVEELNAAVRYFCSTVFTASNLCYRQGDVLRELNAQGKYVDLDNEKSWERVEKLRQEKLANE